MRFNLGAGEDIRDGYCNVDLRFGPGIDLVGDFRALPYPDGCAQEILALDVIEHVQESEYEGVLAEWYRLLAPGGLLTVRTPNLYALCVQVAARADMVDGPILALIRNLVGGHKWPGVDIHHWLWTPATLCKALQDAGFTVTGCDEALNFTMTAVKP